MLEPKEAKAKKPKKKSIEKKPVIVQTTKKKLKQPKMSSFFKKRVKLAMPSPASSLAKLSLDWMLNSDLKKVTISASESMQMKWNWISHKNYETTTAIASDDIDEILKQGDIYSDTDWYCSYA